jgi:CRISPR-associated protein Csm2
MLEFSDSQNYREQLDKLDESIHKKNGDDKKNLEKQRTEKFEEVISKFEKDLPEKSITNSLTDQAIMFAEFFGRYLVSLDLSTSQIRNVFGEIKRLQQSQKLDQNHLLMIKPRLVYSTERKGTKGSKKFREVIEKAFDMVIQARDEKQKITRFENFANFFEAILAYHRSFGGK